MQTPDTDEFQSKLRRLEALIHGAERLADVECRLQVREVVQALLDLHRTGIDQLLEHVAASPDGTEIIEKCVGDGVVSGLLLLHGLHPHSFEERVRQALDRARLQLNSHGGGVELLGVESGVVRVRIDAGSHSCASSLAAMRQAVEEALTAHAPDAAAVEIEGWETSSSDSRFALPVL